ncbi:MAG: right-handed parallel beta-helix repeat-containing protein [Thermoplasmatota archaeon]|jgi:parallel beta-helix repeat protein
MKKELFLKTLAFGIVILFVNIRVTSAFNVNIAKELKSLNNGNILYVGGNGPGNYSSIQAAINDSSDGDTIFVFAYSSPYFENLIINTSINLVGEDRNTTIIDGEKIDDTIWIRASFVNVSGFTILNSSTEVGKTGVLVIEKKSWQPNDPPWLTNINISNCIIRNNRCGIRLLSTYTSNILCCYIHNNTSNSILIDSSSYVNINNCKINYNGGVYSGGINIGRDYNLGTSTNITVSNCSISNNEWAGLWIADNAYNIEIYHNNIFENTIFGIFVSKSNTIIYNNHIYKNGIGEFLNSGILIQDCIHGVLVNNNVIEANNKYGLCLLRSKANKVIKNNFIGNICNAFFIQFSLFTNWNGNYWTDWIGLGPKLIKGKLGEMIIPWVNFDLHPAHEPYSIKV